MSRFYEVTVEIKDYEARQLTKIVRACCEEWNFTPDDFIRERTDPLKRRYDKVIATGRDHLCLGEPEREFADRLARVIWKANGGFCHVDVHTTCLEDLPYETQTYDEDDYERMTDCGKEERQ